MPRVRNEAAALGTESGTACSNLGRSESTSWYKPSMGCGRTGLFHKGFGWLDTGVPFVRVDPVLRMYHTLSFKLHALECWALG